MANKIFSERIKELREQRHLSMQELANYLEVSKSSVNMWKMSKKYDELMAEDDNEK